MLTSSTPPARRRIRAPSARSKIKGFAVRKPHILVYVRRGGRWQLGALEWVFTTKPAKPPLPEGPLDRLLATPFAQDVMIGHIQCVLEKP